jgi:hypothetical protein
MKLEMVPAKLLERVILWAYLTNRGQLIIQMIGSAMGISIPAICDSTGINDEQQVYTIRLIS